MPKALNICLLGEYRAAAGRSVALPTRKTELLLAFLAMHAGQAVPRERLRALLWSDRSERQAAGSLRRALSDLRHGIDDATGAAPLETTPSTVLLRAEATHVDTVQFEDCLSRGTGEDLIVAANTYRGDLLADLSAPDPMFEDWLRVERERLRRLAVDLAERLAILAQNEDGIDGFLDSIDWGWFYFLTKPIFWLLHNLNALIGNMGLAIIALTLLIKAALFPLAYKSYVSMAKMKELQPKMEELKERAGDDRQKLQQGMMELYKKEKVNPASGCLPILLQIPIFFSLYKVIFVTLELRHAPFFGWLNDLSAPDSSSIFNLYGLLPYAAPEPGTIMALIFIGVLPLLLGVSMWLQQKLNPAPTDPTQAMIFAYLPWVFMFMLGSFASGLLVYWITNNTVTFIQQYTIMRSQGFKPDVFGNIRRSFQRKKPDDT